MSAHVDHVKAVFKLMQQYQLYAKMAKCAFGVPKVEYLGHLINVAGVLTDPKKILKKERFSWTQKCTEAFNKVKQALVSAHVLAMLDYSKLFIVETDASGKEIGQY
ncbi:putative mitochondrial protein AtMg00860 [Nicotiana tabacum]|uniref:Mitochondrial protein AtMg00860 n=1 Tax=Nicotiana tabacum TaxID=4097 RepID=A0AC58SEC0_TOBAC